MFKIPSPCVGICSTALGDKVCRGCKRRDYEVDSWVTYDEDLKTKIDLRLESTLSYVVKKYIKIVDQHKLEEKVLRLSRTIKIAKHRNLYCNIHDILRAYKDNTPLEELGIELIVDLPLVKIMEKIDEEWYTISRATFNT